MYQKPVTILLVGDQAIARPLAPLATEDRDRTPCLDQ